MTTQAKKWADEDSDGEESPANVMPSAKDEVQPDGSVLRTITEYTTNEKGQKIKIVKKIKIYKKQIKVNRNVEARRKWRKFGDVNPAQVGPEDIITSVNDDMHLEYSNGKPESKDKGAPLALSKTAYAGILCRNCGREHWTHACPFAKQDLASNQATRPEAGGPSKYQPPGKGAGSRMDDERREEVATVRVANLSEDTKESDLSELFRNFGPVSRIYLAKDKTTGISRGFAYVNFVYREDAAKAIAKLNGYGYDHLILHLEWAKPSNKA